MHNSESSTVLRTGDDMPSYVHKAQKPSISKESSAKEMGLGLASVALGSSCAKYLHTLRYINLKELATESSTAQQSNMGFLNDRVI